MGAPVVVASFSEDKVVFVVPTGFMRRRGAHGVTPLQNQDTARQCVDSHNIGTSTMVKRDNGRPGTFNQKDPANDNAS